MAALVLIAAAVIAAGGYALSLTFFPWWSCRKCGGSKIRRHPGKGKIRRAHGGCQRCQGEGRHPRLGVKIFTPSRAQDLVAGKTWRYG